MISTDVIPIIDVSKENNAGLMIPSIQRNYKWGPGHSENDELNSAAYVFLEDMIDFFELRKPKDIYFTGTLIVFEEEGEERTQLMDGQQRWTSHDTDISCQCHELPCLPLEPKSPMWCKGPSRST